ncbi:alpha/beta hydrolase [Rhizobiaceae bacterium n13]|uniref:Alpha/beta hydrolase n=1 Tax=Ferirhizobium litorale TaxID=2927786 RepID=A0AAE3QHK0_9HYPH|nr:alpha/beta hydrolase [Fererhizobium litorale]MDI7863009.1 alpha/beta hydrolase [Fererhizobium litorale]MDI7923314.1 alpha/beta hydrolase [Fererhizobium litorale]
MTILRRDDVSLYSDITAGTDPAIVLVHGWCCDHSYCVAQVDHFSGQGRRVVAVDLRGHGRSDKPQQTYSMQVFADDVAWTCGELGLVKPIVVGHSMGGIVAFELAARYPDLPGAIVMLDAAVARPAASRAAVPALIEMLGGANFADILRDFVDRSLFISTDDPARKARIVDAMASTPQHVAVAAMQGLQDYDPEPARGRVSVPSLYIAADEPQPRSDMALLRALVPHLQYGQTVGSGHFCQMEVPEQVNAMIDRFLAITVFAEG